jgi:iron complex outermembrane recepter protein
MMRSSSSILSAALAKARTLRAAALALGLLAVLAPRGTLAQGAAQTGSVGGRVVDEQGTPLPGVQIIILGTGRETRSRATGEYVIAAVPTGAQTVQARLIGYRGQTLTVTVAEGQRATQDFTLTSDPLGLESVVVTGNVTPRTNLKSSVAVTAISSQELDQAMPRSTTEVLRYVPGFTRVESSGGEVNQNVSMRGILGVEYVMFMEDGLPVFPTMHTFFMNADNLFRPDENIERLEVVRGGTSALFGSNTPGAIVNFINKTGGTNLSGTMKASAATEGLARYDFNMNGPLGDDWRFNLGGFYRYDHGVRDPGFPGIRGGQLKGSVTRLLSNGYIRASVKTISDRNQFILPLPFQNLSDPHYVPGFSDYGSMNTNEGNHVRVPTPTGELELPLDDGLKTDAAWLTADAQFDLANGWRVQNTGQVMRDDQAWNAILPFDVMPFSEFITRPTSANGLGLPAGTTYQFVYTNHFVGSGTSTTKEPFIPASNGGLGLVSPGGEWHVEKPLTAFQDQFQLRRSFGPHAVTAGLYFANYTQTNRWYFTDILMDVRDNPRFLDLTVTPPGRPTRAVTSNGFRRYVSNYVNGSGQTTVVSGMLGASLELTDRLRVDLGGRYEYNNFVQTAENASNVDLDKDTTTTYDIVNWGNNTFRHLSNSLNDWAGSAGVNFSLTDAIALYLAGARAYKMPALDEFLVASAQGQVEAFEPKRTNTIEGGVKYSRGFVGGTLNAFYTQLKRITSQGAVVVNGQTVWILQHSNDQRSKGVEAELSLRPIEGLQLQGSGTWLRAEVGSCKGQGCPAPGAGADVGSLINGVPKVIGNFAATYALMGARLTGDWHYVGKRTTDLTIFDLGAYNYFNFGASVPLQGTTLELSLLNAFQSKGLEEGNPRLALSGGATSGFFLARPILPRRFLASLRYDF